METLSATTNTTQTREATNTASNKRKPRGRERSSYKPPTPTRLLAGAAASIATGIVLGKLTRDPWSHQVDTFDDRLLGATQKTESHVLDPVMAFFSNMGEPQPLYSVSGLLAAIWLAKGAPTKSLTLALTLVGSVAIDQAIKSVVKRPRPYLKLPLPRQRPAGSSFPSSHASSSLATYGAIVVLLTSRSQRKKARTDGAASNQPKGTVSLDAVNGAENVQNPQSPNVAQSQQPDRTGSASHSGRNKGSRVPSGCLLRSRLVRVGLPAVVCALIGWSRVYRGVHNPSD